MGEVRQRVSYTALREWPEDGRRYELYDGEVLVTPSPLPRHQLVVGRLFRLLDDYATAHGGQAALAPLDIVFSEYDVVQPDLVVFGGARRHVVTPDEPIRSGPDLAVEVLSPSTESVDRGRKMHLLARYGVPEYWLVNPSAASIEVYEVAGSVYVLRQAAGRLDTVRSATLPELEFPTSSVFPD